MECDLAQIKEILLNIKIKGAGGLSPDDAKQYLLCLKRFQSDNKTLTQEVDDLVFQLEGQAKINVKDFEDHQKRQEIVDLILRLDKKTRQLFVEKGLDTMVLVQDPKMRHYLEEIQIILESMNRKPNLNEVVNMFKEPDVF